MFTTRLAKFMLSNISGTVLNVSKIDRILLWYITELLSNLKVILGDSKGDRPALRASKASLLIAENSLTRLLNLVTRTNKLKKVQNRLWL